MEWAGLECQVIDGCIYCLGLAGGINTPSSLLMTNYIDQQMHCSVDHRRRLHAMGFVWPIAVPQLQRTRKKKKNPESNH